MKRRKTLQIALIVLSIVGVVVMGYLVSLHYSPEEGSFCDLGEGLSCDIVNKSIYSKVFGVPMSVLGLIYFLGVLGIGLFRYDVTTLKKVVILSTVFLGPSLYLSGIEIFVLKNICIFCEFSKLLILGVIAVAWIGMRPEKLSRRNVSAACVAGVLLAGIVFLFQMAVHSTAYSSSDPGAHDTFARCLYDSGMRMYGSVTCSFCAKQRALFGSSFEHIKEIECDPRNPHAETERCIAKNISHTPTWILEDEDGNDVYRFDAGMQPLEKLAEVSGCPLVEDE